jgi:hypothetical protein
LPSVELNPAPVTTALNVSGESGFSSEASATPSPSLSPVNVSLRFPGNQLQLNWPADHTGWRLETKTNLLQANWSNFPGTISTNGFVIPTTNGSAFFHLVYP